jgi:hypothetical protein
METETASLSSNDSSMDCLETLETLEIQIKSLVETSHFLHHRLDTIQSLLDQQSFDMETVPLRVAPYGKAIKVRELLEALELQEDNLQLGTFLRALNKWLIQQDLVDLNDLQIILSPLVASAFQKPQGLKKIPYALLLTALPKMFI